MSNIIMHVFNQIVHVFQVLFISNLIVHVPVLHWLVHVQSQSYLSKQRMFIEFPGSYFMQCVTMLAYITNYINYVYLTFTFSLFRYGWKGIVKTANNIDHRRGGEGRWKNGLFWLSYLWEQL